MTHLEGHERKLEWVPLDVEEVQMGLRVEGVAKRAMKKTSIMLSQIMLRGRMILKEMKMVREWGLEGVIQRWSSKGGRMFSLRVFQNPSKGSRFLSAGPVRMTFRPEEGS